MSEKHVRGRAGFSVASVMEKRNAGVEERDARDRLHVKVRGAVAWSAMYFNSF